MLESAILELIQVSCIPQDIKLLSYEMGTCKMTAYFGNNPLGKGKESKNA